MASFASFKRDGAERFPLAAVDAVASLIEHIDQLPPGRAGVRLRNVGRIDPALSATGTVGRVAAMVLGGHCFPVRAVLFDKIAETNWSVPWHQDRTIAVLKRTDVEGFGPWTHKDGIPHVAPPFDLLSRIVTLRVHLATVDEANAPLRIACGSHRFGRVAERDVASAIARCRQEDCMADAGDIWMYSSTILHASDIARKPARRRVLQVDYAAEALPGGLEWAGV